MLSISEAIEIINDLFKRELETPYEERSLGTDEMLAIQVLYDYIKHLEHNKIT